MIKKKVIGLTIFFLFMIFSNKFDLQVLGQPFSIASVNSTGGSSGLPSPAGNMETDSPSPTDKNGRSSFSNHSSQIIDIYITTNRPNYIIGQPIQIFVWVFDNSYQNGRENINIEVSKDGKSIFNNTILFKKNELITISGPNTDSEGIYKITAKSILGKNNESWITFKVVSLFNSVTFYFIYLATAFS